MPGRQSRIRLQVTEYLASTNVVPGLLAAGMTANEVTATLTRASARLRRNFKLTDSDSGPILVDGDIVKVVDVAGVLRLAPGAELDVAPKFLGDQHDGWREDLLAISNYTQRGQLSAQSVRSQVGHTGDLASIIGRAFVDEFSRHNRKPLRLYQHQRWRDFSLDGDLDTDEVYERSADGLPQRAVALDRRNPYNALMAAAADVLIADVLDSSVRNQLVRVRRTLGGQPAPPKKIRPVPARHQPWAGLVELSERIVSGADLTLHADRYEAPGFVVRTWEAWERLTFLALRHELGHGNVKAQVEFDWGWRSTGDLIKVKPDVSIPQSSGAPRLVDAKYKTRIDKTNLRITQADLMEAAAFMTACDAQRIVLLYPRNVLTGHARVCGAAAIFDLATVKPGYQVLGVDVEVRGFSARGEHRRFAERLTAAVEAGLTHPAPAVGQELN